MSVVRVRKPGGWEAVIEVKPMFGSAKQLAAVLAKKGLAVEVIAGEVIVTVPT